MQNKEKIRIGVHRKKYLDISGKNSLGFGRSRIYFFFFCFLPDLFSTLSCCFTIITHVFADFPVVILGFVSQDGMQKAKPNKQQKTIATVVAGSGLSGIVRFFYYLHLKLVSVFPFSPTA